VLSTSQTTEYLRVTDFDFAIPSGATIDGIEVSVERSRTGGTAGNNDHTIQLTKDGTSRVGSNKAVAGSWPLTTDGVAAYGGAADLWGTTWTDSEINASTFGVHVRGQNGASGGPTLRVDHVTITVTYTESAPTIEPSGSLTPAGSLVKKITKPMAGALAPAGALATRVFTPLPVSGSLTPTGALTRITHAIRRGTLTPAGTLRRDTTKALAGALTPAGSLATAISLARALGGTLDLAGELTLVGGTPVSPELTVMVCAELDLDPLACVTL
jgi:hypothetical protein